MVNLTPQPLYPEGRSLLYPLNRRLGGPQIRSGEVARRKNPIIIAPAGNITPVVQSIA
jgi:hypothetical protein